MRKTIEEFNESVFEPSTCVNSPANIINVEGANTKKGNLSSPKRYTVCVKVSSDGMMCGEILDFDVDECPKCHGQQEKKGDELSPDDDTDDDGIPDMFEMKLAFLDRLYTDDAKEDEDGDGFTNLEEYRAKTKLDDPNSKPDLAYLLRLMECSRKMLPFVFERLRTVDSNNPADWKIEFSNGKQRFTCKIGEKFLKDAYTLVSADPSGKSIVIAENDGSNREYTMNKGEKLAEEKYTVKFVYFNETRQKSALRDNLMITVKEGENFTLPLPGDSADSKIGEKYILLPVENEQSVNVGLYGASGNVEKTIAVNKINEKDDFSKETGEGKRGGMRGPETEGGQRMSPKGPQRRPVKR